MKKKDDSLYDNKKKSSMTSTQSVYKDSSGRVFSAQDIVQGYKPKKPYRLHSLSDRLFKKKKKKKK